LLLFFKKEVLPFFLQYANGITKPKTREDAMNISFFAGIGVTHQALGILAVIAALHFAVATLLWLIGLRHENHSVLDSYWGFAFVAAGWIAFEAAGTEAPRAKLVLALVTIWGARLGYHLFSRWARIHGLGGDLRYQDIKETMIGRAGYWWKSLLLVIWPMALAIVLAQINVIWIIITPNQPPLGPLDVIFAVLMLGAIILETTADLQLDAFKANRANEGKVLRTGVWAWSRHPNYFSDFCCYWCVFIIGMANRELFWTVISPLFMSYLLIGYTGRRWMDGHMKKRRPEYAEYISVTSSFIPLPPRKPSSMRGVSS